MAKKALIVANLIGFVGFLWNDIEVLKDLGYEVSFAANSEIIAGENHQEELEKKGVKFYQIGFSSKNPFAKENIEAYRTIERLLKKEKYDVVHCHTPIAGLITRMAVQAFDNTKLIGHYYEREKGAPLIVFFHGLWGHSYLDGVPIYRITQKHNWNLLLCDLRAQGDSEGEFSTLGVLEKYDCLDWVEWAQNRFGDKNPIFLMGVSMGASIVMMSSDLELPDSVYGIIDDCGFTSTLDVIKQNKNKQISKYIPKNLFPTIFNVLNVGTKIWGSFDLSDADACKALAHTDIPLLIIHGDEDMQAPLSMAYKLYDSCNGEKQLYIVHGADHSENYRKDPGGYEKIVTKFIEERIERKDD